jgi:hypothetical protein
MYRNYLLLLGVAILLLLLTGSQCTLVISSGDSSDKDKDEEEPPPDTVILTSSGRFIDAPVEGLRYVTGRLRGTTGPQGEFLYDEGSSVQFYIGAIALGTPAPGKSVMTPLDLIENGTLDTPAVINIARLLQSLDSVRGDARITLPASGDEPGLRAAETLAPVIEHLDFHDETNFVNAASQVVATLTADYPFTVMLVDAPTARRHLAESLAGAGIPH